MRYAYACFKGYIGFHNGLGLDKVEIDFTKCKNNIVVIFGINGCGKSTLLDSLNLFPDPSSAFVPNMDAEKLLTVISDSDIYEIRIISPVDIKGNRKQTKAFIKKNGLELNDNGNITSYKEVIFSEFELDSNYIALSKLSGNDRGLGDKTPSERKRFASAIVDNLETYNQIYKTLNKKSLIFKSQLNTLHTKIQNIGTKENLEMTLSSLKQKEVDLNRKIMDLNNQIVSIQTRVSINEEEALNIQKIKSEFDSVIKEMDSIYSQIKILIHKTQIKENEIESKYESDNDLLKTYTSKLDELKVLWTDKSQRASRDNETIQSLEAQVASYMNNFDEEMEKKYQRSNNNIGILNTELRGLEIEPNIDLIYPLTSLLDFYDKIIIKIEKFYDGLSESQLNYIVNSYNPNERTKLEKELNTTIAKITEFKQMSDKFNADLNKISVLENRPKECKVDKCPFIAEALEIKSSIKNMDIDDEMSKLLNTQISYSDKVTEIQEKIDNFNYCTAKRMEFDAIISSIAEMKEVLLLFHDNILGDTNKFINAISKSYSFNEQRDPKRLINGLNLLKELKIETELNQTLEIEYKAYKEKKEIINSNQSMIDKLKNEQSCLLDEIAKLKSSIENYQSLINSLKVNIELEFHYVSLYHQYTTLESKKDELEKELNKIEKKSSDSIKAYNQIQEYQTMIDTYSKELNPIVNDINIISGQLTMLNSYYNEYNMYKEKYNMIEVLKKYSSPTNGGIQTIFMQLYMGDTLTLSNKVLEMIFGGNYRLLDFIINENEFRIPFQGNGGLPVDDISSGSTSQICIMGMIINLVLLYQASTKFNIARLDEIDGGLDHRNRTEFVSVLRQVVSILGIDQLFIISHSIEADTSFADIIKLKTYSDFEDAVDAGNVIYDYSKIVN